MQTGQSVVEEALTLVVHLHLAVSGGTLSSGGLAQRRAPATHVAALALGAGPVLAHLFEHQPAHLQQQQQQTVNQSAQTYTHNVSSRSQVGSSPTG